MRLPRVMGSSLGQFSDADLNASCFLPVPCSGCMEGPHGAEADVSDAHGRSYAPGSVAGPHCAEAGIKDARSCDGAPGSVAGRLDSEADRKDAYIGYQGAGHVAGFRSPKADRRTAFRCCQAPSGVAGHSCTAGTAVSAVGGDGYPGGMARSSGSILDAAASEFGHTDSGTKSS